ncbi:MAG TPA: ATP-binding cassette domain-containing protein [Actinomycetota bacterium]|nr:ATP-binding cassette domain-containing protein [Actinomycetota bacterium]
MDTASHPADLLRVSGLERRFGTRVVFRDVEFSLQEGDRLILRGPNGSGKSSMLRCIAGVLEPTRGSVTIAGLRAGTVAARERVGAALAQDRSFYLRLSGRANLSFFARLRLPSKTAAVTAVRELEEELELAPILDQRMASCSTGMLQQVAFARALLGDPSLLLLDEPTRSLDDAAVERFWGALDRRPHCAAIVATHRHEDFAHGGRTLDLGS